MISPDEWRAAGQDFEWRGHHLFSRVGGDGDALLLIHGFPTASWDYAAIWPELARRFRMLTLDMIGFGFSAKPRRFEYSIAAQADLFEALLAREHVTRVRVLAHDYGVSVAQELLARQRETATTPRIAAVCLLNGGLFTESHRPLRIQRLLASRIGPLIARLSSYRMFAASMRRIWGTHPAAEAELRGMWQLVAANDGTRVLPKLLGYLAERRRHRERWVGALVQATAPLLLINGVDDPVAGAETVARYRELVPDPHVAELAGVGHYPQIEAPDAVLALVLDWFTKPAP